eukprot:117007-Rhodomonas_salina.1
MSKEESVRLRIEESDEEEGGGRTCSGGAPSACAPRSAVVGRPRGSAKRSCFRAELHSGESAGK